MNKKKALEVLLEPLYTQCKLPNQTLSEFADEFLDNGGTVQLNPPKKIQERININIPEIPECYDV